MLTIVKAGGVTLGAGVLLGLGVVGWLRVHPPEAPMANSRGGSVGLSDGQTTPPVASLKVDSPPATPAAAEANRLPGPSEFQQYQKYKDSATAMFGDIKLGDGAEVRVGSRLIVLYRGWLSDGTLFDAATSPAKPFSFVEGEHHVIRGWEEGLLGMKAGGKRRLIVPPSQGYGPQAHPPIPANSTLIFDVELLEVK